MLELIFYALSFLLVASSALVVTVSNPVHAVLFLIFAFFNACALFVLIGAEYIAMTLVIVYVGAVAVLFLFVVMMLDIDYKRIKKLALAALPIAAILSAIVFFEINWATQQNVAYSTNRIAEKLYEGLTNTEAIGIQLYTKYALSFQLSGLILLVAMIGAIVLTLNHGKKVRRQSVFNQLFRTRKESVEIKEVEFKKGVELP